MMNCVFQMIARDRTFSGLYKFRDLLFDLSCVDIEDLAGLSVVRSPTTSHRLLVQS